jgi:hypothetical protein
MWFPSVPSHKKTVHKEYPIDVMDNEDPEACHHLSKIEFPRGFVF